MFELSWNLLMFMNNELATGISYFSDLEFTLNILSEPSVICKVEILKLSMDRAMEVFPVFCFTVLRLDSIAFVRRFMRRCKGSIVL